MQQGLPQFEDPSYQSFQTSFHTEVVNSFRVLIPYQQGSPKI